MRGRSSVACVHGLTLVETLIAAVILFGALAFVSDSYRGSLQASVKASNSADLIAPLPLIVSRVKQELRTQPSDTVTGQGVVLGIEFSFEANVVDRMAPPERFNIDTDVSEKFKARFLLYRVQLELRRGGSRERFTYQELSWLPLERR